VRVHLIAREGVRVADVEAVLSHPQPLAQCQRFLRETFPSIERRSVSSTAAAVRMVSESARPWAALGARAAAELYDCELLMEGVEDQDDNVTRFVWIAPEGTEAEGDGPWKTSLVFSELGADHPGALVDALSEFSSRGINLTRIESRPLRQGLGRYMFFCDLEGKATDPVAAEATAALRTKAESVRILGSYSVG
jgi:prephenate dehydratase